MEGFTIIDGVAAAIVLISGILAFSRGLVRETLSIAGWIAAAILAFIFATTVEPLIKEIPVLGEFFAESCELSIIAAFAAVFAVALIVVSLLTPLFSGAVQRSALGGVDQGLGFFFGVLRGLLLIVVAFLVYERVVVNDSIAMVDDSRSAAIFASVRDNIEAQIPDEAPQWIVERYEQLVGDCGSAEPVETTLPQVDGGS
ncbi:colicin V production CvpA [Maritimibacter sp. 55A14]|uniref:CvpA family protein n=1 Tax=Maritimibacter sp. 55A14 TaxID=2174844 RepID=UPI000D617D9A|nr:CvpA family protein [Maritimibacter sp. 55A14]PWE34416.1 colicin V production CvpA [Maritimibacter sp. 55A14]